MRLTVDRAPLLAAVSAVAGATGARSVNKLLGGTRLVADDGRLTLSATDLERWLSVVVPASVHPMYHGQCVVSPDVLKRILAEHRKEMTIDMSADDTHLRVKMPCGDKYELALIAGDGWPEPPPAPPETPPAEVTAGPLLAAVRLALAGVGPDDTAKRHATDCVLFDFTGGTLTVVGSDATRLFVAQLPAAYPDAKPIVPRKAATLLVAVLSGLDPGASVRLSAGKSAFFAATDTTTLAARLGEGKAVPWEKLAPGRALPAEFRRADLHRAVSQALISAPAARDDAPTVTLAFAGGVLSLTGEAATRGKAEVECRYTGELAAETRVNGADLRAFLGGVDGDTVAVDFDRRKWLCVRAGEMAGVFMEWKA